MTFTFWWSQTSSACSRDETNSACETWQAILKQHLNPAGPWQASHIHIFFIHLWSNKHEGNFQQLQVFFFFRGTVTTDECNHHFGSYLAHSSRITSVHSRVQFAHIAMRILCLLLTVIYPSKRVDCVTVAMRSTSLDIKLRHFLQDARPLFEYSTLNGFGAAPSITAR